MILTKENFNQEVLNSKGKVLVDFYADWCGPCKMISPILEELAKELAGKVKIFKVNVDKDEELSDSYNVWTIPALVVFNDGKEINRTAGFLSKQKILSLLGEVK
ncbi:MAG: thioredoxin [Bacilli bacterium]|jgi:thioredoxin 1